MYAILEDGLPVKAGPQVQEFTVAPLTPSVAAASRIGTILPQVYEFSRPPSQQLLSSILVTTLSLKHRTKQLLATRCVLQILNLYQELLNLRLNSQSSWSHILKAPVFSSPQTPVMKASTRTTMIYFPTIIYIINSILLSGLAISYTPKCDQNGLSPSTGAPANLIQQI